MNILNKFLKIINITLVERYQQDLSSGLNNLERRNKKLLIFGYNSKNEKILFETEYKIVGE